VPPNLKPLLFLLAFLVLPGCQAAEIPVHAGTGPYGTFATFIAEDTTFRSPQVHDIVESPHGDMLFATAGGLAFYNGSWTIWHPNLSETNTSRTILQDTVVSLAYDSVGRLWIGYGNGLQVWNGQYFTTINDPQLLKDRQILHLQRWNDTMWIATGHSGIHRYDDKTGWTWYQPFEEGGADFYQVESIAPDPATDTLFLTTFENGLWQVRGDPSASVEFVPLTSRSQPYHTLKKVKSDPLGGVYFFDPNRIVHYLNGTGFTPVLAGEDLQKQPVPEISDIEALPDAVLAIATNRGIYLWQDGAVLDYIYGFAAAGAQSDAIDSMYLDSSGRLWFEGRDVIGYYESDRTKLPVIPIGSPEPTMTWQVLTPDTTVQTQADASPAGCITGTLPASPENGSPPSDGIGAFFESIGKMLGNLFSPGNGTT